MTGFQRAIATIGGIAALLASFLAIGDVGAVGISLVVAGLALAAVGLRHHVGVMPQARLDLVASLAGMLLLLSMLDGDMPAASWPFLIACWLSGWVAVEKSLAAQSLSQTVSSVVSLAVPVFFGAWIIFVWEVLTIGLEIPTVLLPPPSMIAVRFAESTSILWADFQQTVIKAALSGYIMGCGSAFIIAILIDRIPFLQRGLLPVGNFISALPIVGIAPIMVMWFGFDWQSKAAVVVVMTFFPMLVNTVAGLQATQAMERDLLRTYASSYFQLLIKLRLPTAAPFIFNALKINSTLALIGAIVAEFFGTPIVGLGFRISTEVGRMNVDMVWAEIVVAALAGSLSYGLLSLLERQVTFWHPSNRRKIQ
ncbi:MAG: ABC transporter permease [Pseudomonadota bacterium]|nr:ABC transporter permease [Pseudomonadota bacterium]